MCGIVGIVSPAPNPAYRELAQLGGATLAHRGPDGEGSYNDPHCTFVHKRLSIIDLSSGSQPLYNEKRDLVLVCNGEIYNYRKLKSELQGRGHVFRTGSDCEVILHLYEEGVENLRLLRGMYAAALWNTKEKRLLLLRDRLGIKPLYYAFFPDGAMVFASEIKAILATGVVRPRLDPFALKEYLSFKFTIGERTFFQSVQALPPGTWLDRTEERTELKKYWEPSLCATVDNVAEAQERLEAEFHDSIDHHLVSDVPVGAFLSGGLDTSSIVFAAAARYPGVLRTYTCGTKDEVLGDLHYSRLIAEKCGTEHTEVLQTPEEFSSFMRSCLWFLDEPGGGSTAIHGYYVAKRAREDVKVLLSGEGADEILGGYYHYWVQYYRVLPFWRRLKSYPSWRQWGGIAARARGECFSPARESALDVFAWRHAPGSGLSGDAMCEELQKETREYRPLDAVARLLPEQEGGSVIRQTMFLDLKSYLYRILHIYDRMCMSAKLENRVPFLDHKFVEYAMSLSPNVIFHRMQTKAPLRTYVNRHLGSTVARRPKSGFTLPVDRWFRNELRPEVEGLLAQLRQRGILKPEAVDATWQGFLAGGGTREDVWRLLSIELWHQIFIDAA